jgi:hypothetical protein
MTYEELEETLTQAGGRIGFTGRVPNSFDYVTQWTIPGIEYGPDLELVVNYHSVSKKFRIYSETPIANIEKHLAELKIKGHEK